MQTKKILSTIIILVAAAGVSTYLLHRPSATRIPQNESKAATDTSQSAATTSPSTALDNTPTITQSSGLVDPIAGGKSRVTKKPFGIYVSPGHSPISPERFTGFHTGADFETTPEEQNADVAISAICNGPLLLKEYVNGYGGVAVQSCTISSEKATVLYGHLRLASITPAVGDQLKAGQTFAVLGTGYSTETDGERKHLHLSIHKGPSVVLLGYVQKQSELSTWIDPETVLP